MLGVTHCKRALEHLAEKNENTMVRLLLRKWSDLSEIIAVLQIPHKAPIALQKVDLTLSDAFGIWLKISVHLQALDRRLRKKDFSSCLIKALDERKHTIFDNPAMLCAIYLDPRFRGEILRNDNLVRKAIERLSNLWRRLCSFREELMNSSLMDDTAQSTDLNLSIDFDNPDILNDYLSLNESARGVQIPKVLHDMNIEAEIELFQPEKLPSDASVIAFWQSHKEQNERLFELAMVIFAIPPTEVQIERDFSLLEFIFSQRRQSLSSELLEAILSINLNSDIFNIIKDEELTNVQLK